MNIIGSAFTRVFKQMSLYIEDMDDDGSSDIIAFVDDNGNIKYSFKYTDTRCYLVAGNSELISWTEDDVATIYIPRRLSQHDDWALLTRLLQSLGYAKSMEPIVESINGVVYKTNYFSNVNNLPLLIQSETHSDGTGQYRVIYADKKILCVHKSLIDGRMVYELTYRAHLGVSVSCQFNICRE